MTGYTLSPKTAEVVARLADVQGRNEAEVIRVALSFYAWVERERANGSRLLLQRGDVVTELRIDGIDGDIGTEG